MLTLQSDVGRIKTLLMRHPRDAFVSADKIENEWQRLFFLAEPDLSNAVNEADALMTHIRRHGIDIQLLPPDPRLTLDALYARDAALTCNKGVILANMGKANRAQEPDVLNDYLLTHLIPVAGRISGSGKIEGGDVAWVDEKTLAVAHGYRTNQEGIRQLREILADDAEVVVVPLPHWNGPNDVLHLMSFFSPIAPQKAVVYSRMMPVPFRQLLIDKGYSFIEVPDSEYDSLGCNVLALAPDIVVIAKGNPIVKKQLQQSGCEVIEYDGHEISWKGSGGPTCLTRPLWRECAE